MTISIKMLAPAAAANVKYSCQSGNSYTSDAYGVISGVVTGDVNDLANQDCIPLGQSGGKSNFAGTGAPAVTDDSSKDYVAGSHWVDITHGAEYVCSNPAVGSAVWVPLFSSYIVSSMGTFASFAAIATTPVSTAAGIYGFTTAAQAANIVSLANYLRTLEIAKGIPTA